MTSDLGRLLDPGSIAIVGLSADPRKHGARVLGHLRRLGFPGEIWGVNPGLPPVSGAVMYPSLEALPRPADLVVAAVPASALAGVVTQAAGSGAVIAFAAGFAERGEEGVARQHDLRRCAADAGTRLLGPNSGGVIRPARRLAASFLTCLERPPAQIRSGPVGLVTQSGGTGSYLHNLAAARSDGLAVSVATGNEADLAAGEAIGAVSRLEEVKVVLAVVETLRDGETFVAAVREAHRRKQRVVVCRIGTGEKGGALMSTHTGAMAIAPAVIGGLCDSLGVVTAETPAEAFEVASVLARTSAPGAGRPGIITHSGGAAILLADLAERRGVELPVPTDRLRTRVEPLLDHGIADNPLDLGGIIGGPSRFAEVVDIYARSGEYDALLAVSTAHPPAHTGQRVASLLELDSGTPTVHLWMAGDQAEAGLAALREANAPVTEDPRAAVGALAGLLSRPSERAPERAPVTGPVEAWGLPLDQGMTAADAGQAVRAAEEVGFPVVLKIEAPGLAHKTEVGAVKLDLRTPSEVERAFADASRAVEQAGWKVRQARIQRFRPGLEMIAGAFVHPSLGPMVSVGTGGVLTEVTGDTVFAPAPVDQTGAEQMIDRLRGRRLLAGYRGGRPADVAALAGIIVVLGQGILGSGFAEVELNPLVWHGGGWVAVDWLAVR